MLGSYDRRQQPPRAFPVLCPLGVARHADLLERLNGFSRGYQNILPTGFTNIFT